MYFSSGRVQNPISVIESPSTATAPASSFPQKRSMPQSAGRGQAAAISSVICQRAGSAAKSGFPVKSPGAERSTGKAPLADRGGKASDGKWRSTVRVSPALTGKKASSLSARLPGASCKTGWPPKVISAEPLPLQTVTGPIRIGLSGLAFANRSRSVSPVRLAVQRSRAVRPAKPPPSRISRWAEANAVIHFPILSIPFRRRATPGRLPK